MRVQDLDWQRFLSAYFPGSGRHDLRAITAYATYKRSRVFDEVNETLVPKLKLPGFAGYYLIEAGNGVFSSLGLFETAEQETEPSNVVATWIRDEKLETLIPNPPTITSGQVDAHRNGVTVS